MNFIAPLIYNWVLFVYFLVASVFFPFRFYKVPSASMEPTLQVGDWILTLPYQDSTLERGALILFSPPQVKGSSYVKRVIGLPGERFRMSKGRVFLNGQPLDEPYTIAETDSFVLKHPLLEREYFVLGDNRRNSLDSRSFGPVYHGQISRQVLVRFHQGQFIALPFLGIIRAPHPVMY